MVDGAKLNARHPPTLPAPRLDSSAGRRSSSLTRRAAARLGIARALYVSLALFAVDVLVIGVFIDSRAAVIAAVIVSGVFIGTNKTITTRAVMTVAPVPRPIASAS